MFGNGNGKEWENYGNPGNGREWECKKPFPGISNSKIKGQTLTYFRSSHVTQIASQVTG